MAIMVGAGIGAQNSILFKNASALEDATNLNVIIFDKTGTLTMGQPEVAELAMAAVHSLRGGALTQVEAYARVGATSITIISPPPPIISVLLFSVWCGIWQWINHFPGLSAFQITS